MGVVRLINAPCVVCAPRNPTKTQNNSTRDLGKIVLQDLGRMYRLGQILAREVKYMYVLVSRLDIHVRNPARFLY